MLKKLRSPLYLALLLPALLAATDLLSSFDHVFWNTRSKFGAHSSDGTTVVINLSDGLKAADKSSVGTAEIGAVLLKIGHQMPRRVFVDTPIHLGKDPVGDALLSEALSKLQPDVALVVRSREFWGTEHKFKVSDFEIPSHDTIRDVPITLSAWHVNFMNYGVSSPYLITLAGRSYPTFAAALGERSSGLQQTFAPDVQLDTNSVPKIDAGKFLKGDFIPGLLTGRTVIVSARDGTPSVGIYGRGRMHPLNLDMAGAEALKNPVALAFSGYPILFLVWFLIFVGSKCRTRRRKLLCYSSALFAIGGVPVFFQLAGVSLDIGAGLLCVMIYGGARVWQKRVRRVQHTSASGLPNLLALSAQPFQVGCDVVVAVIARYEEILATLPKDLHGECARQIARRLAVGSGIDRVYNGEGGHFAWTEEARPLEMQLNHLEGLRALFSAPLQIGSYTFDTNIHFGLDRNEGIDSPTRVNSAVASANDALASGRSVELFEAERLAEAPWELSLHARIDEGLRNGEIWLAFQSQWEMREGRACGAEALIRWSHPTRGPIAPDAFILQAERAGRIDAITFWVLDEAITATLALAEIAPHFQMSINLSAQMVDKPSLVSNFVEIIRRRNIDPHMLTIEVTETSSVRNRPAAVQNLSQLRAMGFRLSIDDFGTGEASLAYLADLPSDELKLDRRFVSRLLTHQREREIIRSTIDLAHALGQTVVAEGIEDEATYLALARLGCDIGQGYYLGRPQPFAELYQGLLKMGQRRIGAF